MTKFVDSLGLKRLVTKIGKAVVDGTWLPVQGGEGEGSVVTGYADSVAEGPSSHAEGISTAARGEASHSEGRNTIASGKYSHAQGYGNYDAPSFINMVGVGGDEFKGKNAVAVYVGRDLETNEFDSSDPKNGYQYLLGVGGYQGQDIAEGMKSVQEVIADLEKGVAATETMTVEEIREIMSA
ncbi:hypothetical protein [Prevotella sp.]|nr:hypothetical protein [Prevotella sp.]